MILAAALMLLFLDKKSFWLDEAFSITIAQMDWPDFFYTISQYEANQGFYYFVLHLWVNLGQSEFVLRILSVIFALGIVVIVYRFGIYLKGNRTGLTAALLITVNAFFITYAQEARGYILVLLLTTLSSYFFLNAIEKKAWKWWLVYVLCAVLGMYTHLYAVFVLVAQYVVIVFLPRQDIPWKKLILSAVVIGFLFLPMIIFILTKDIGQIDWALPPRLWDIARTYHRLSGQGGFITMIAYFIPGLIACIFFVRIYLKERMTPQLWRYAFLLSWLVIPIVLAYLFSYIKPIYEIRYFVILLTPFVFLVAIGLDFIKKRWLFAVLLIIIVLTSVVPLRDWYTSNPKKEYNQKEDWREITSYIAAMDKPGDVIMFFHPVGQMPFEYYRDRLNIPGNMPPVVHYLSETTENLNIYYLPGGSSFGEIPDPDADMLDRLSGHDRVWLVISHTFDKVKKSQRDMILNYIKEKYNIVEEKEYISYIRVYLFVSKDLPTG